MEILIDKELRKQTLQNEAQNIEGFFTCRRCKSKKTSYYELQTRSADETDDGFSFRVYSAVHTGRHNTRSSETFWFLVRFSHAPEVSDAPGHLTSCVSKWRHAYSRVAVFIQCRDIPRSVSWSPTERTNSYGEHHFDMVFLLSWCKNERIVFDTDRLKLRRRPVHGFWNRWTRGDNDDDENPGA